MTQFRTLFVEYLSNQSDWRQAKQEEYPDDFRNGRSASALIELRERVSAIGDAPHDALDSLDNLNRDVAGEPLDGIYFGEQTVYEISRYGFNGRTDPDPDAFLASLAVTAAKEREEWLAEWAAERG